MFFEGNLAMVAFKQAQLTGLSISNPTSLQFGPDGRLYVSQTNGVLAALTVEADGAGGFAVTARETINNVRFIPNHNDDGTFNSTLTTRQVTGILVAGTADKPVLYVSSSDPRIGGGTSKGDTGLDTNSGILSKLTKEGNTWVKTDLVVGLPRSEENHAVNGLQFNPQNGRILLTVGGNTNAGAPSQEFGLLSEYAYSAAVVEIDVAAIEAMSSKTYRGQTYKYALPTLDDTTRPGTDDVVEAGQPEVFGGNNGHNQARLTPDSPVQIFATGFRNLYDIVINGNGQIYGIDNGGNPTWGGSPMYRQPDGSLGTTPTGEVTNAINDGSGAVNKAPLHLIEKGYYGGHANPIRANPATAGLYDKQGNPITLPANWAPVPASMANPVEGYYLTPGSTRADILPDHLENPVTLRGELATFLGSVNGIDEYRSVAFNGEMLGDLIAASLNDDRIYRINLSADGKSVLGVTDLTPTGVLGNGSALDVHAAPASGPFAGTLWVASYGGGITVMTPDEESGPPPLDQDIDDDGLNNNVDPFPVDPMNGLGVPVQGGPALNWSFSQNEPHPGPGGIGNLGFTGVMTNGQRSYTEQYDANRTIMGGAAAGVLIQNITPGSSLTNDQTDAYQFGVGISPNVATYTITGKVNNPFESTTPRDNQSVGFFIGTGSQADYIRLVAGAATVDGVPNTPVIQMLVEVGDVVVAQPFYKVPVFGPGQKPITPSDAIVLTLTVDPVAGTVTPGWSVDRGSTIAGPGDVITGAGSAVTVTGSLLAAIRGNYMMKAESGWDIPVGLAVGIIGTSEGPGDPFSATWNSINISSTLKDNLGGVAEMILTPNAALNVSTFNSNTVQLSNLAESKSDLVKVVFNLENAILPDGIFFDPNTAGGNAGKGFQINSQVGTVAGTATYQNGGPTTGYRQMTLNFNGFNPGESIGFSVDIDPDSMLGFNQSVLAGEISGAEMAGSRVTFHFADGSITEAEVFGSQIAQGEARGVAQLRAAPTVSLLNATSGNLTFPASDPTITVQGSPGVTVRVQMMTVGQLSVPFDSPFKGNSATNILYETVVLDSGGRGSVSASLTPGQVLVVAAAEVDANGRAISAVSQELRIIPQGSTPPPSHVGTDAAETLTGTQGPDSLDGRGGNDTLLGLGGNDYLNGGTGADRMEGGPGDDMYVVDNSGDVVAEAANAGNDAVSTSLSSYTLPANVEELSYSGSQKFTGTGNALANVLSSGAGADRLDGAGGADVLRGGLGNDTYVVENVGDVVIELANQGDDRILSQVNYTLPDHVETLQLSTSKALNGTGNNLANTLLGNAGINELDGRGGQDVLTGGGGNDVFIFRNGEANGDRITDFQGAGAAGGDVIRLIGYGSDATLTRVGTSDSYLIQAGAAFDHALETIQISGVTNLSAGDYTFVREANGSPTNILLSNSSVLESAPVGSVVGTLTGVDPDPGDTATFTLTSNADGKFQIVGNELRVASGLDFETQTSHTISIRVSDNGGNSFVKAFTISVTDVDENIHFGTPGDDVFTYDPSLSYNTVDGLGGIDTLNVTANLLTLSTSADFQVLDIGSNSTVDFRAKVEQIVVTGTAAADTLNGAGASAAVTLRGLAGNDVLSGGSAADLLDGGAGNDQMSGGAGDDTYVVDSTSDTVTELAGAGTDTIQTSVATYSLGANVENLTYTASANAVLTGNALNNVLTGGIGRDRLDGGAGADRMIGGAGSDTYVVDNVGDVVVDIASGGTDDRILSQVSYTLPDYIERLQLTSGRALDGTGNSEANILQGNAGVNQLDGRGGADTLTGGGGNDVFIFRAGEAHGDTVTDFEGAGASGGDRLSFSGYGSGASLTRVGSSDSYVIHGGTGHSDLSETITLTGVTNLNAGDWAFL